MVWYKSELSKCEVKSEWVVENKNVIDEKCPCAEEKVKVVLSQKAYRQIKSLCRKLPKLEWLAGLVGSEKGKDEKYWYIEEIKIFEQKVGGATVELTSKGNEDIAKTTKIIGWIHSHNNMDVFFSNTDEDTAKASGISLTTNNKIEFFGRFRRELPCGHLALVEIEMELEAEEDEEITTLAETLISEKPTTTIVYSNSEVNANSEICILCGYKVGKKKRRQLTAGVVHNKCFAEYVRIYKAEFEKSNGFSPSDDYLEEVIEDLDRLEPTQCEECMRPIDYCVCDVGFNSQNFNSDSNLRDYVG